MLCYYVIVVITVVIIIVLLDTVQTISSNISRYSDVNSSVITHGRSRKNDQRVYYYTQWCHQNSFIKWTRKILEILELENRKI